MEGEGETERSGWKERQSRREGLGAPLLATQLPGGCRGGVGNHPLAPLPEGHRQRGGLGPWRWTFPEKTVSYAWLGQREHRTEIRAREPVFTSLKCLSPGYTLKNRDDNWRTSRVANLRFRIVSPALGSAIRSAAAGEGRAPTVKGCCPRRGLVGGHRSMPDVGCQLCTATSTRYGIGYFSGTILWTFREKKNLARN